MVHEWLIFAAAVGGWIGFLWLLYRAGFVERTPSPDESAARPPGEEKFGFALLGPFLMWKTGKGRAFLDRLALRRRFWRVFGDVSIALVALAMVAMTALLFYMAALVVNIPQERAPTPDLLIGIPGLNRLIPIWYGIFALALAIIVHEFCHGILARVSSIRLRSLGLLFFIVPVGAFVEPSEEEMRAMPRRERARLYAAGPAVNLLFALATAFVFSSVFMAGVSPVAQGVGVVAVESGSPAEGIGLSPGIVLLAVDGTPVPNPSAFSSVMANTSAGDRVAIVYTAKGWDAPLTTSVTLADAFDFTNDETRRGRGFLGVRILPQALTTAYFHPIGGADELGGLPQSALAYISLPFAGLQPLEGATTEFFVVNGPLAAIPEPAFWIFANVFYWVFWLNLMLGLTNSLPAVPLDGGYLFRDGLHAFFERVRRGMGAEARDRAVKNVSYVFALMILTLIVWQLIGPRIL